jgi:16S rRNA (guanine527-N7)-methyltransferase
MSVAPAPRERSAADAAGFAELARASPAQMADLEAFRLRLADANQHMNLVGPSAMEAFWSRHAWDSAQLIDLAPGARHWADLGAGAGFPGVILAILLKGVRGARVELIDSMAKRCRFLTEVVEALGLPASVHNARAETLKLKVEVAAARACAPLVKLLGFANPYLERGAVGLFLKGQDVASEMEEAARYWVYAAEVLPSRSDERGRILRIESPARVRRR